MKKWIVMILILFPLLVLAQTPTPVPTVNPILNPPVDTGEFITWVFSSVRSLSGASATLIIAFCLTVVIGLFKLTPLEKYWIKLGKWKFIVPITLGAVIEIIMTLPHPFTWGAFFAALIAGAIGVGPIAIALKTIWNQLFPKPTI